MINQVVDRILNQPDDNVHTSECTWQEDPDTCNCGAAKAGTRSAADLYDIRLAQLKLAQNVALTLIRDCTEHTRSRIQLAFSSAIQELGQ